MAPTAAYMIPADYSTPSSTEEPISRTYQYRKVMKPMLERKRRARINRCLDELKELMVTALHSEGENVSKLEKADILELTVRHLHQLKRQHQLVLPAEQSYADRFRAGFSHCAKEVSQFLQTPPSEDLIEPVAGKRLLQHLGACVQHMDAAPQPPQPTHQQQQQQFVNPQHHHQQYSPPASPASEVVVVQQPGLPMWRPW